MQTNDRVRVTIEQAQAWGWTNNNCAATVQKVSGAKAFIRLDAGTGAWVPLANLEPVPAVKVGQTWRCDRYDTRIVALTANSSVMASFLDHPEYPPIAANPQWIQSNFRLVEEAN